jgi:phosphatidylglycerophosphatase A
LRRSRRWPEDGMRDGIFVSSESLSAKWSLFLASGFFLGFIPLAPGTFGSLLGIPAYWLISQLSLLTQGAVLTISVIISARICEKAGPLLGRTDASQIVLDEAVGMSIALAGAPLSPSIIVMAFVFFRIFDIWKPFPIRQIEMRVPGGWGVVLDDVMAGVLANFLWRLEEYAVIHVW